MLTEKNMFTIAQGACAHFSRGNGAPPHNLELARRKAYMALTFRRTAADWAKRIGEGDIAGH